MAYVLGQYNKTKGDRDSLYMTEMISSDLQADKINTRENTGVVGTNMYFTNECLKTINNNKFKEEQTYYFHGKIYQRDEEQVFSIKLVQSENYGEAEHIEQYIKTIVVTENKSSNLSKWVDVEFIFTPIRDFDILVFEMERRAMDYDVNCKIPGFGPNGGDYLGRKAYIAYIELSKVNDMITELTTSTKGLLKIGIQTRPGFLMCINNEGIRTPRSGIYELKEGVMKIKFFSAINGGILKSTSALETFMNQVETSETGKVNSQVFATPALQPEEAVNKTRTIDNYTLDYIYKTD